MLEGHARKSERASPVWQVITVLPGKIKNVKKFMYVFWNVMQLYRWFWLNWRWSWLLSSRSGDDFSTRSAVQLQPVQGLIQVKRHESIEYMYVEPVKAVCSDVQKLPMNSPDELVHGIAHNIKPESQADQTAVPTNTVHHTRRQRPPQNTHLPYKRRWSCWSLRNSPHLIV